MSRKTFLWFICLMLLVGISSDALANIVYWDTGEQIHTPAGLDWEDPSSWTSVGVTPAGPPNDGTYDPTGGDYTFDIAGINANTVNVNEGVSATPWRILLGVNHFHNDPTHAFYDPNGLDPEREGVLNVYSTENTWGLNVSRELILGHQGLIDSPHYGGEGILNVYGSVACETLRVAEAPGSEGIVNIYDGGKMLSRWWGFRLGQNVSGTKGGSARFYMKGDGNLTIYDSGGIQMTEDSHIDIEHGYILLLANEEPLQTTLMDQIQGYVDDGLITAHGGIYEDCNITMDIFEGDPSTFVRVTSQGAGCPCYVKSPHDVNQDCSVDLNDLASFASDWLN